MERAGSGDTPSVGSTDGGSYGLEESKGSVGTHETDSEDTRTMFKISKRHISNVLRGA